MLTVAARVRPDIEWRQADAVALPFDDHEFDIAMCQMALMFMSDRAAALREMSRVVKPDGCVAVVVPAALEDQPAFKPFVELAARLCGPDATSLLTTYFVCGDLASLERSFVSSGLRVTDTRTVIGTYAAPTVEAAVTTEVESTPLAERISESTYQALRAGARRLWQGYVTPDGALAAPFGCHFVAGFAG
jgi:SAM-dependent methyltransferase